ncbi:hypothetical protein ANRL3_00239 [Anaerolineae bacterium]|nr:hypothetical protein ANRL3_00239 [Anaerolineae bacterium]
MKSQTASLAGRALLAVLLTIGFYGMAIAIAALLLWVIYAEFFIWHRVQWQFTAFCAGGAIVIIWAILPRWDSFTPPGPRLTVNNQPRLFAEVREIARRVNQHIPAEVYLVPDVNAFVAERGGMMGIGSRRVMGVGLPLMQALTIPQMRAVLAHEFGHFYSGDTKLAPWVYKTRNALARTLEGLGDSILQIPFHGYADLFMRVTQSIPRRQELVADELAARIAGRQNLVDGLRLVNGIAPAFRGYWQNEVGPVLNAGFRPPLVEGLAQFLATRAIADAMEQIVQDQLKNEQTNLYDTHPALRERIAAVERLPLTDVSADTKLAITLLDNVPQLERALLAHLFGDRIIAFDPVKWQDVGATVYVPMYEKVVAQFTPALNQVTVGALGEFLTSPNALTRKVQEQADHTLTHEEKKGAAASIAGMALTRALTRAGWRIDASPGLPIVVRCEEKEIEPLVVLTDLVNGKLTVDEWRQKCERLQIANLELVPE